MTTHPQLATIMVAAALLCSACVGESTLDPPQDMDAPDAGQDDGSSADLGVREDASMNTTEDAGVDLDMNTDVGVDADAHMDADANADADAGMEMDASEDSEDMADLGDAIDMSADMEADMETDMAPSCSGSVVPAGYRTATTTSFKRNNNNFSASNYAEFLGAYPMDPTFSGATYRVAIGPDVILTMPFTIPTNADLDTYVWLSWVFFGGTANSTRVTVSRCPGGVLEADAVPQQQPGKSCVGQGGMPGGDLTFGRSTDATCVLAPGDYHLNIAHIDRTDASGCSEFSCEWRVQPRLVDTSP